MTLTPVINLTDQHKQLLKTDGHLLVLGGPGSGKTTIALLKANHILEKKTLLPRQKLLFLSFARATVSRIVEHSRKVIATNHGGTLEINTYHGFAWNVIRSHGYLLATSHKIRLLPPPEAAALLSRLSPEHRDAEKRRLFEMEGLLHFDLFASVCAELLSGS